MKPKHPLNRREFGFLAAATPLALSRKSCGIPRYSGGLTDVPGIRVGHFTHSKRPTGCTVVLCEDGVVAGVDVRGSAPGTHETDLLDPINTVQHIHGVVLSGGSAFGLETVWGVVRFLEEKGKGLRTADASIPIVPAAILYDLAVGDSSIRPDRESGYKACQNATDGPVAEGNVGAGSGATVGKMLGRRRAMKGGLGTSLLQVGDLKVAALAVVNAVGDVLDPATGRLLAGARGEDGRTLIGTARFLTKNKPAELPAPIENTSLVVVATNARFDKAASKKLAQMSQDGLARAVNPVHTPYDGDTCFALSTGEVSGVDLAHAGVLAAEATSMAVVRAVMTATGIPGYPAYCDLASDRPEG